MSVAIELFIAGLVMGASLLWLLWIYVDLTKPYKAFYSMFRVLYCRLRFGLTTVIQYVALD